MPLELRLAFAQALEEAAHRGIMPDGSVLARAWGPQTDEELLQAVFKLTGHHIPRNSVCTEHGHRAPSETFCDLYFDRVDNVIWIGNRGGGKTANSGELHGAKCRWKDGYKSAIAGAVAAQGNRAYSEFRIFIRSLGSEVTSSILSRTKWANGSETEVLGGTVAQLNGPHPHLAQMDEADLTTWEPFEEFLNMAQGDNKYPAQQLLTSTRKKAHGIIQNLVKEVDTAKRLGLDPPWQVDIFCVFETMVQVENCRTAPENKKRPEEELCQCHRIVKGTMEDGSIRTFDKVCRGRAYRADGFVHLKNVTQRFQQLSVGVWQAQQECLTPNIEGIVHKWFTERHSLPIWLPRHEFGPIYRGWDWGGQNPHAVVWVQLLDVAVGLNAKGLPILDEDEEIVWELPQDTLIQFDEVYKTSDELPGDGGFSDLAVAVAKREVAWRQFGYPMVIAKDFCDPSGFVAKREVRKKYRELQEEFTTDEDGEHVEKYPGLVVPQFKSIPAPVEESVRLHISWGEGNRIRIVEALCPHTSDEYDVYHWPDKKTDQNQKEQPVKEDDHAMDAKRYTIWNIDRMKDRQAPSDIPAGQLREQPKPGTDKRGHVPTPFDGPMLADDTSIPEVGAPAVGIPGGLGGSRIREQSLPSVRQLAGGRSYR